MNLALVSTQTGWGGGEALLATLATGLRRRGAPIAIATPAGSAMHQWADAEGIDCLALPGRGRSPAAMWRLRRWFSASGCDLALLNDPHAITYGGVALARAGAPLVGVRHTCFPIRSAWKHNRLLDALVCVADAARRDCVAAGVRPERTSVIHAGLKHTPPTDAEVTAARGALTGSAESNDACLLALGSLLPVKGFDTLIEAVALAIQAGAEWRLSIAGEGPERPALEEQIARLGLSDRVRLLGFRRDTAALLAAADGFVSASHREGLSLVLVEAMLAGTPVVATPVGGNGEALRLTGAGVSDVARAVPPGEPLALAEAITDALEPTDENRERLTAARAWAAEHFTIDRMTQDYLDLFEGLVAKRHTATRRAA